MNTHRYTVLILISILGIVMCSPATTADGVAETEARSLDYSTAPDRSAVIDQANQAFSLAAKELREETEKRVAVLKDEMRRCDDEAQLSALAGKISEIHQSFSLLMLDLRIARATDIGDQELLMALEQEKARYVEALRPVEVGPHDPALADKKAEGGSK